MNASNVAAIDKASGGIVMIGAVFLIAVFAGFSNGLGKVLVVMMLGIFLMWLIAGTGSNTLADWLSIIPVQSKKPVIA